MPTELISIIIPVYNVEKYLDRCMESVLGQTYVNTEIILVDDGSSDLSGRICDSYIDKDSRVRVIHKENGGLSSARNAGIKASTGSILSFIDSDDWVDSFFLEKLYLELENHHADAVGCQYLMLSAADITEKAVDSNNHYKYSKKIYSCNQAMDSLIRDRIKQVVWNKIYRREVIEGIAFEEGRYHEDVFCSYQVFARIQKYIELTYTGYYYFQREDSIMGEKYSLTRLDAVDAKCRRQQFLKEKMPQHAGTAGISLWFTCIYHGQQSLRFLKGTERQEAIMFLVRAMKEHPLTETDYKDVPLRQRIWLRLAAELFAGTCLIRNIMKIGL